MFTKILIANRGEIACRVASTARRMGIATVAVYSDADAGARHVELCDEAYRLGPPPVRESYLRGDAIIAAAKAAGAEAIHPGYGFLSENEAFARAVEDAGLIFIGPPASAIAAMGNKSAAKALMAKAGVPLVPGYHGEDQDAGHLALEAQKVGYPVLIKASSGGGGKGMRIVSDASQFDSALLSCKREALASFGDDRVLIERYLQKPRHIEIQVFADRSGHCVYLFERDCSVQRRHQKVLEEAPAPGMDIARREAMGRAAVAAAQAVNYVGAGTVEFIANQDGSFFFMEMNTRLQVEHPVTELVTGFDLVEWQLKIAAGANLPVTQDQLQLHGHAIEARIYAENPIRDFLPATGTLSVLRLADAVEFDIASAGAEGQKGGVRIDSGVRQGDVISPYYDPMIAKLIVWGKDRNEALLRMRGALRSCRILGVATNLAFLERLIRHGDFAAGALDTGLIDRARSELLAPSLPPRLATLSLAVAALLEPEGYGASADPWQALGSWRLNGPTSRTFEFESEEGSHRVQLHQKGGEMTLAEHEHAVRFRWAKSGRHLAITLGDETLNGEVDGVLDQLLVDDGVETRILRVVDRLAHAGEGEAEAGRLTAPMPGKVVSVLAKVGATVARGTPLMVMEAMKMEHTIAAPADGVIGEVLYAVGDQVAEGAELVRIVVEAPAA
jgi:3-methylcrotonyl-CoA carboxylase alpha subunit